MAKMDPNIQNPAGSRCEMDGFVGGAVSEADTRYHVRM